MGVVVPTRNRPNKLKVLLNSLSESTVRPDEIVVVASGQDVCNIIRDFQLKLNIKYEHSSTVGQVRQKARAIEILDTSLDWCIFTDDDLVFSKHAIEEAMRTIERYQGLSISGVGFALTPTSRVIDMRPISKWVASQFGFLDNRPGRVTLSGHGVSYLQANQDCFTDWLNGVSMWKLEVAKTYQESLPNTAHASCEDLLFSYQVSRSGKLVFSSTANVYFQTEEKTNAASLEILKSTAYWRLYFVRKNKELSVRRLLVAQAFRTIYHLIFSRHELSASSFRYFAFLFGFIRNCLKMRSSIEVLNFLIGQEA